MLLFQTKEQSHLNALRAPVPAFGSAKPSQPNHKMKKSTTIIQESSLAHLIASRTRRVLFCTLCFAVGHSPLFSQESPLDIQLTKEWQEVIRPMMNSHCGECHMETSNEGGVNFEDYQSLGRIREHASTWEQIRGVIRAEAMPPPDSSKLTTPDREKLAAWVQSALHDVDCSCSPPPPKVTLRRLNQVEYDNTVRDLFNVEITPSKAIGFVSDDVGNGFDNQGEVLTLPPIMLEKYLQAAALIAQTVIETDRESFRKQRFEGQKLRHSETQSIPLYLSKGKYSLSIKMRFGDKQPDSCKVRISLDGTSVSELDVPSKDENYQVDISVERGEHHLAIEFLDDEQPDKRTDTNRILNVQSVGLSGPDQGEPAFPKRHEVIVIATPEQKDTPESQAIGFSEAASRVFRALLPKAYRRPASADELSAVVSISEKASAAGFNYEESIRFGLQAVLVSPNFLFRTERTNDGEPLDHHAIATRLSYFLWSTMPDQELMSLAQAGTLRQPAELKKQVNRMLESPRAEGLIKGFFVQWLGLRNLSKIEVDREKFPRWNERLQQAMVQETEMFCMNLLRNGNVDDVVDATYTFVNPRLAEFYGLPFEGRDPAEMYQKAANKRNSGSERRLGVYDDEDKWIRVDLENNRKGLLTQASVLALTSNPTRTSPVKRGKWILENILGDPPPSAPPGVPSLDQGKHDEGASLRERLEIHRSNPSCAGCHKLMDPIGLGLENFDVIGKWRDRDGSNAIDAQGQLADGRTFNGPTELVALLSSRKPQIIENISGRMLTYALGRGLQRQDKCDINRIVEYANQNSRSIRSMVEAIVMSDAFLQQSHPSSIGKISDAR